MNNFRITFIILFALIFSTRLIAQSSLKITCTIFSCQDNLDEMNFSCENLVTNKIFHVNGKRNKPSLNNSIKEFSKTYEFVLSLQTKYRVTFSQMGCGMRSIYFETNIPKAEASEYWLVFKMALRKQDSDLMNRDSAKTFSVLYKYVPSIKDFDYENNATIGIAEMLYNIAVEKTIKNEFSEALIDYNEALTFNPEDINSLYNRGIVKLKLLDNAGACQDWNKIKQKGFTDADELLKKYCN